MGRRAHPTRASGVAAEARSPRLSNGVVATDFSSGLSARRAGLHRESSAMAVEQEKEKNEGSAVGGEWVPRLQPKRE